MISEFISISVEQVREIHELILQTEPGLVGEFATLLYSLANEMEPDNA